MSQYHNLECRTDLGEELRDRLVEQIEYLREQLKGIRYQLTGEEKVMCPSSDVSNAGIYRVMVKTPATNVDARTSRSISPEARRQARVKVTKKQTKWCNQCRKVVGAEGENCAECNKRLAAELGSRDGTYLKACSCGWSDFITVGSNCPDCGTKLNWRDGR